MLMTRPTNPNPTDPELRTPRDDLARPVQDPVVDDANGTSLSRWLIGLHETPKGRASLIGSGLALGLLILLFWPHLRYFAWVWSSDENYSHGFLVPLMAGYFASEAVRRHGLPQGPDRGGWIVGVIFIAMAIGCRWATTLFPIGLVGGLGFLFGLAGLIGVWGGLGALRRFGFPLAFLAFAIPLPVALYTSLASPLQLSVSQIASSLMNAIGIPTLCQGNRITLPGGLQMFVAEACSGMRQLTGFLALTTAVAFLSKRPRWESFVLILSSVPIAMTANVARVILTGWIMYRIDPQFATGAFHTLEGLVMLGFGLSLLCLESWLLGQFREIWASGVEVDPPPMADPIPRRSGSSTGWIHEGGSA